MVQISSETPEHGARWVIHMSLRVLADRSMAMEDVRRAARIAASSCIDAPSWVEDRVALPRDHQKITQRAIEVYMLSQKPNGEMGGIGWWQTANGYTAMALHDLWSGGAQENYETLNSALQQCEARHKDFINVFNDDTLWWGMLCVHMYSLNHDHWYLERAQRIWKHVKRSVCKKGSVFFEGRDMEGAVFWTTRSDEEQINAISTALFAELSVRLALLARTATQNHDVSEEEYIEAARCSLGWILRCRYRLRQGLVLDHIKLKQGKAVDWVFTYNTGVTLGVCALLYEATGERDYMVLARHMAIKAMTRTGPNGWVEDDGVLTEKHAYGRGTHDPWKPNDVVGFKAVLVRQLCMLYDVIGRIAGVGPELIALKDIIKKFININFRSQLDRNTNGKGQYGAWWDGPFECPTSHAQMAVLDVMAAVKLVNR